MNAVIAKSPETFRAWKIDEADTNYFAMIADPVSEGVDFTILVEIYEPGGATPPNTHSRAHEFFYILEGTGKGFCDGAEVDLAPGSTLLLPPGKEHIVKNTGQGKLYALCVMIPNEDFAELIHSGTEVALTEADKAVLTRTLPRMG